LVRNRAGKHMNSCRKPTPSLHVDVSFPKKHIPGHFHSLHLGNKFAIKR